MNDAVETEPTPRLGTGVGAMLRRRTRVSLGVDGGAAGRHRGGDIGLVPWWISGARLPLQ